MSNLATLAGIRIGAGQPVRIMGVINVSPESFFKGSIENKRTIQKTARRLEEEGADFIDIGAMSTAPYLKTALSDNEEAERLSWAVKAVRDAVKTPISVDTSRPLPAQEGLNAGANILNDITGLAAGREIYPAAKQAEGVVLMAHPSLLNGSAGAPPVPAVKTILIKALQRADDAGVSDKKIVLDPGIGFFRNAHLEWWQWDLAVLRGLAEIAELPAPLLVGVSRKSFISQILDGKTPEDRLYGSLGATVAAVMNGAAVVRTHDVAATKEAVRVAQAILTERIGFRKLAPIESGRKTKR